MSLLPQLDASIPTTTSTIRPSEDTPATTEGRRKSARWGTSEDGRSSPSSLPTSDCTLFTESDGPKSTNASSRETSPSSKTSKQTTNHGQKQQQQQQQHQQQQQQQQQQHQFQTEQSIPIWLDPRYHPQQHRQQRHRHPFPSQILCPRPYEQIFAEIAYLTGSLQVEACKTAKLISQYSLVQEALKAEAAVGKHRRKLRKQLSSLKCRISRASHQEKAVIVRLSELHMEAQSRNTWTQVQRRRMFSDSNARAPPGRRVQLNAACSEFVPSRALDSLREDQIEAEDDVDDRGAFISPSSLPPASDELQNRGLAYTYDFSCRFSLSQNEDCSDNDHVVLLERRLSLPNLQLIWPES